MRFQEKASFERSFKKLSLEKQQEITRAIDALTHFFESHIKPEGLGLKHLRGGVWEIRSSLRDRILFSWEGDVVTYLIVGNHDEIRRYLKTR